MHRYLVMTLTVGVLALLGGCQSGSSYSSASPEISACNRLQQITLPAGHFDQTAHALTQSSDCFIKSDLADMSAVKLAAVSGRLSIAAALSRALAPTHLHMMQHGDTLIVE